MGAIFLSNQIGMAPIKPTRQGKADIEATRRPNSAKARRRHPSIIAQPQLL
jgi:hypothetical protein